MIYTTAAKVIEASNIFHFGQYCSGQHPGNISSPGGVCPGLPIRSGIRVTLGRRVYVPGSPRLTIRTELSSLGGGRVKWNKSPGIFS